jgi:hypothetical protein
MSAEFKHNAGKVRLAAMKCVLEPHVSIDAKAGDAPLSKKKNEMCSNRRKKKIPKSTN